MTFKIGLAQTKHSKLGPIAVIENAAQIASDSEVDLLVFSESMMTSYGTPRDEFIASAESLNGQYVNHAKNIAIKHHIWIVTTLNEKNSKDGLPPYNTAVIIDSFGQVQGFYRKVHLFDSYQTQESMKMSAGDCLFNPIESPFCKIGLGICYDLRFPELARYAASKGAELLLYPAAWLAGDCKIDQWETMLKSRAIENGMYVAGICRCDDECIGHTSLFDPMGNIVCTCGNEENLLIADVDIDFVSRVRKQIPILNHLRPELY